MELNERSHILDTQQPAKPAPQHKYDQPQEGATELKQFPDTPESSKSDLHQLISAQDGQDRDKTRSSTTMASFNFINSIIGSGIIEPDTTYLYINAVVGGGVIGMPFALKEAGFGMGIILVLVVTLITDHSLVMLIHAGALSNTNTYQDVMRAAFGRPGFIILTLMQFLYPLIAMISYNVIIGDTITKIVTRVGGEHLSQTIIGRREFVIAATTLVVTLPLSLYRNIAKLSKVSLVSIMFIVFIIAVMIARGFTMNVEPTEHAWRFASTGITRAIGIMAFAYMCHHNSFLIYDSLEERSEAQWSVVTHASLAFSMVCTLVLGVTGYITFTGYSQGDVLENYCHRDDLINAARFLFACTIMLTFPIECFVCREVTENSLFAFQQPAPLWRHLASTVVIVLVSVIVSLSTDCLGIVLEFNGVVNAAPLAFIFPALCVLKLQNEKILSVNNIDKIGIALFGAIVCISGLVMSIISMVNGVTCSHGEEMPYCVATDRPEPELNSTLPT